MVCIRHINIYTSGSQTVLRGALGAPQWSPNGSDRYTARNLVSRAPALAGKPHALAETLIKPLLVKRTTDEKTANPVSGVVHLSNNTVRNPDLRGTMEDRPDTRSVGLLQAPRDAARLATPPTQRPDETT